MTARRRITAEVKGADAAIEVAGILDELAGAVSAFEIREADALWRVEAYPRAALLDAALGVKLALTAAAAGGCLIRIDEEDRKSTRLNSSHRCISYAVFC